MTTNTGTGGFPIDGKLTIYDVGSDFGDIRKESWDPGDINVDQTQKDLSKGTKRTLANYLSRTTLGDTPSVPPGGSNVFPINHTDQSQDPTTLSLNDEKGYPSQFTQLFEQPQFQYNFGSSLSPAATQLKMLKGRQESPDGSQLDDGNSLLKNAVVPAKFVLQEPGTVTFTTLNPDSTVKPYTEGVLKSNEYSQDTSFTNDQVSQPLRRAQEIDTTPYNGMGEKEIAEEKKEVYLNHLSQMADNGVSPMNQGNAYGVDFFGYADRSLTDEKGYPSQPGESLNQRKYLPTSGIVQGRSSAADPQRLSNFIRGRENKTGVDGNTLLKDVTPEILRGTTVNPSALGGKLPPLNFVDVNVNSPVRKYYGAAGDVSNSVIYNRFNISNQFSENAGGSAKGDPTDSEDNLSEATGKARWVSQQFAAKYTLGTSEAGRDITYGRLAQIGNALSMRGGVELRSQQGGFNPTDNAAVAGALLPGTAQLGVDRIPREDLEASKVIESLTQDGIDGILIDPARQSWGTLNNVNDQFSGISNFGMQLLAAALVIAMTIVIGLFTALFGLFSSGGSLQESKDKLGRNPYGRFRSDGKKKAVDFSSITSIIMNIKDINIWELLGIQPTTESTPKCIEAGGFVFFGAGNPSKADALGQVTLAVVQSPGYYSVMSRTVSRSFLIIGDAFSGLVNSFGAGNLVDGFKQLFELLDTLRSSKFMRALNIFAQIGDRYLKLDSIKEDLRVDEQSTGQGVRFKTKLDIGENSAIKRSRLDVEPGGKIKGTTLAWSSYRAPDLFIMPNSLIKASTTPAANSLGMPPMLPKIAHFEVGEKPVKGGHRSVVYQGLDKSRIDTKIREQMEDALEAEYVPFYIHDVRTNEIVSFHAFLASLNDSYSAAYDSSDGFGRVEPVKTYKGTTRKIDFSFYIVATSNEDFNSMWLKINKLTTFLYPQFTEGRTLVSSQGTEDVFYAPFSQTIQAAPLVRVRIGDLIRSNYSKFNMARIFGYTYPGTKFGNEPAPSNEGDDEISKKNKAIDNSFVVGNIFLTNSTLSRFASDSSKKPTNPSLTLPKGYVLKIVEIGSDGMFICEPEVAKGEDMPREPDGKLVSLYEQELDYYAGDGGHDNNISIGKYKFYKHELSPAPSTQKKIATEAAQGSPPDASKYGDAARQFVSDDFENQNQNAITRSFRSSGGKGLAGFIESMSFNWMDKTTWEYELEYGSDQIGLGRRAPKMCLVTVGFTPVHDISPGLDHLGANRAPIYPVGSHYSPDLRSKGQ